MASKGERESIAGQLKTLDRDTWQRTEDAVIGIISERDSKFPLLLSRDAYIKLKVDRLDGADADEIAKAQVETGEEFDKANDRIHNSLVVIYRNCSDARAVLHKYRAGRSITVRGRGGHERTEIALDADGRSAWMELKSIAMGGQGIETVESALSELYGLGEQTDSMSARQLTIEHETLVRRILDTPDISLDLIFKTHLLKCIKRYGNDFDVVEHQCSTDRNKSHSDTVREIHS